MSAVTIARGRFAVSFKGDRDRAQGSHYATPTSSLGHRRHGPCERLRGEGKKRERRRVGVRARVRVNASNLSIGSRHNADWPQHRPLQQHLHQHQQQQPQKKKKKKKLRGPGQPFGGFRRGSSTVVCSAIGGPWTEWAAICFAGVGGLFLERNGGELVKTLSAPLLATLIALTLTNVGLIPSSSEVYTLINKFMLPLAVPMLLLGANLRKVFTETKRLLGAFLLGSVATCIATCVTFYFIPLANLGAHESWKIASALASRHIGGAVNFIAVAQTLEVGGDAVAAALAADNLICALYFMTIFYITRNIGPEQTPQEKGAPKGKGPAEDLTEKEREQQELFENASEDQKISVYDAALSLGFSSIVCYLSSLVASNVLHKGGLLIPIATFITVALATLAPKRLEKIAPAGEGLASIIMQFFFAAVGASGSIQKVLALAPLLFVFSFLQVYIHLILILVVGKMFKYSTKELVLASNANVGGPTTAAAMCVAKQWRSFFVPSMLSGILGYAIATFISIGMGQWVLQPMAM